MPMKPSKSDEDSPIIIAGKWKLIRPLGSGSFGEIYEASHMETKKRFAVKLEQNKKKIDVNNTSKLYQEFKCYSLFKNVNGIPQVYYFGSLCEYDCMVMDLLGPSLDDLFNYCHRKFSVKTISMLAIKILELIKLVHEKFYIHRDIKPANFLMGHGEKWNQLFIIDFGLSKSYVSDQKMREHIPFKENRHLIGTPRYFSYNTHKHYEQSRRDDLESICYVLIYFINGSLPWQGLVAPTKAQKYEKIAELKLNFSPKKLAKKIPEEFANTMFEYLKYCRNLSFSETPNYDYLKTLFESCKISNMHTFNISLNYMYDWSSKFQLKKKGKSVFD